MAKNFPAPEVRLFETISELIHDSRMSVARAVNRELTLLYWNIGRHIRKEILDNKRAGYGDQVIEKLSRELTDRFGRGWSKQQLWNLSLRCREFSFEENYLFAVGSI